LLCVAGVRGSILRLQKRILELEATNAALREDVDSAGKGKKIDMTACLPRAPPRSSLAGHRDAITCVLFHPVYSLLLSASEDASVKLWDYESGRFERSLAGHQDGVTGLALSDNGQLLASCSVDLSIKLWDLESGAYGCIKTLHGHDHTVSSVAFVPGNELLVSASRDKSIKVWEVSTGFCIRTLTGHEQWVRRCIVSPLPVSTSTLTPIVQQQSAATSTTPADGDSAAAAAAGRVASAALSSSSSTYLLASCSMDQTIRLWLLRSGECVAVLRDHTHVVEHLAFSNAAADATIRKMLADDKQQPQQASSSSSNHTAAAANGASAASSPFTSSPLASTANTGGGEYLLSSSRDKTLRLWHIATSSCVRTLVGHDNWVRGCLFAPSGRFVLSCSDDKSLRCWDLLKQAKCVKVLDNAHHLFVSAVDWNRTLPMIASGGVDHSINLWDCR
jgi:platelet-activating factor acetylhydrolase IB subunit alpha